MVRLHYKRPPGQTWMVGGRKAERSRKGARAGEQNVRGG